MSFSNGLPKVPVYEIALDEVRGRAWAGTHGRGVFVLTQPMLSNFEGWVDGGIWDILEGVYNVHSVFTSGATTRLSTIQGGVRVRF